MYCIKCGAQLELNASFCTHCGASAEIPEQRSQQESAPPASDQQGFVPPAAGAGPYAGAYAPLYAGGQPVALKPKRKKGLIWILSGAVAAVAIILVLVFVVFAGGGWPLSGNTLQTRFVNENFEVFNKAFGDISLGNTDKMLEQPFEFDMNMDANMGGQNVNMQLEMAYDEHTLGYTLTQDMGITSLLLLDDTLFTRMSFSVFGNDYDETNGIRFDSDADLSRPMPLKDRLMALARVGENDIDTKKLAEMFFNSISEDCFDKNAQRTRLRMNEDDFIRTLETFVDKLDEEKEINQAFRDLSRKFGNSPMDLSRAVKNIIPALSNEDFEFVWMVKYDGGSPRSIEISFEQGGSLVFEAVFDARRSGNDRTVLVDIVSNSYWGRDTASIELNITKQSNSIEYEGNVISNGQNIADFSGQESWSGDDFKGSIAFTQYENTSDIDYTGTLKIGKPANSVDTDSRYKVDKKDAEIIDLSDTLSMFRYMMPF